MYRARMNVFLAAALLLATSQSSFAATRSFIINDEKYRDLVSFNSDALLELIVGNTSKISGKIDIDETLDLSKPATASFDVDLASIDTGIPLRNEHMRDNFLETKKYPKASFVLKKLINPPKNLSPGKTAKFKAQGDFTCHGKTVSKTVPIELTYLAKCKATESKREGCDLIQIKTSFPVAFKDHDIKRPEVVFQKLADTVIVTVSATAYNQVGAASGKGAESKALDPKGTDSKEAEPKATGNKSK